MAIPATKLHQEFRRRANRGDSSKNESFEVIDIDSYLNEAQNIYYTNRLSLVETSPQIREEWRKAEVKDYCDSCNFYKKDNRICLFSYPEDYYRRLRQTANVSCTDSRNCDDKDITLRIAQSDDISEILTDPFRKPSFEYGEAWADEAEEGLYVYHNNAFKVNTVCISYYKKLPKIAAPSLVEPTKYYVDGDGVKVTKDQGFILDSTDCWRTVVDIAALCAFRDITDRDNFQLELNKILSVGKI